MANEKKLEDLSKEELIEKCESLEEKLSQENQSSTFWFEKCQTLEKKLSILKNILEL